MSPILTLAAVSAQAMIAPHHPPVIQTNVSTSAVLIDYRPGAVTCDGAAVSGTLARPLPTAATLLAGQQIAPSDLSFRIGEDGRPLGIVQLSRPAPGRYFPADDLQPALAASHFAAGRAYRACTVRYEGVASPVTDAPLDLVFRYLALPHTRGFLEAAVQKRARDASPGCFTGKPPTVLNQAFPDQEAIPQPQGALSLTVVGFDIDGSGKPVRLRTLVSDGNAALDAAGRDAIAKSRYGREARTGCTLPFYRRQSLPLAPPPPPPITEFRTNPACDEDGGRWDLPPRMTFPEPFRRRGIEGWAVIRYDVAPWGQTGNVTVLASEPAAMFGERARQIIQSAKRPASATGATGCVDRVRFRFRLPEGMTEELSQSPPYVVD